MFKLMTM